MHMCKIDVQESAWQLLHTQATTCSALLLCLQPSLVCCYAAESAFQCCVNGFIACLDLLDPSAQTLQPDGDVRYAAIYANVSVAAQHDIFI